MSKFNTAGTVVKPTKKNLAGGPAYEQSAKLELVSTLLTSFIQSEYYRSENQMIKSLVKLIENLSKTDPKFVAKSAIFARDKFNMRSVSHLTAAELLKNVKGHQWLKGAVQKVCVRPDDMTEIVAYFISKYGKPIPNALKKGIASAFGNFDEYQLAKYRGEGKEVSLVDVVNLVHPKPTEKNADALKKLIGGTLRSKDTWEAKLTKAGQEAESEEDKAEKKAESWKELIEGKKLGYFALLRNLRNILEQAPEVIDTALKSLTNEKFIKGSRVLPFRFMSAYNEMEKVRGASKVLAAIDQAATIACDNVPKFDGATLIALDISGSMGSTLSGDGWKDPVGKSPQGSSMKLVTVGTLFAAALAKVNDCDFMTFTGNAKYISLATHAPVITIAKSIMTDGYLTNLDAVFHKANRAYDRILILSDMQNWVSGRVANTSLKNYKTKYKCNPHVYPWDMRNSGTMQFPEKQVYCLAGWSEKVFDIMKLLEQDKMALVHEVEKIEL